jgi:hypothetical protein
MQAVNVLCIKWGKKYGPEYVNKLHSMVRRHLHRPFRFVCLTDDAAGIDPASRSSPFPWSASTSSTSASPGPSATAGSS